MANDAGENQSDQGEGKPDVVVADGGEVKGEVKAEGSPEAKSDGDAKADASTKVSSEDWKARKLQERISKLTARNKSLEEAIAASQRGGTAPKADDDAALLRTIDEKANAKAAEIAAQAAFDRDCMTAVEQGEALYGKEAFKERTSALPQIFERGDKESEAKYALFLSAIIDTGDAPKLLYELGDDLPEAERIMKLSPAKMGIELAKLAAKVPEPVSAAPKPITPVGRKGESHVKIDPKDPVRADSLSTAEWMARRNAEIAERQTRRY